MGCKGGCKVMFQRFWSSFQGPPLKDPPLKARACVCVCVQEELLFKDPEEQLLQKDPDEDL